MKTVLSIDWDFFIYEDSLWDLGHRESEVFVKMLWTFRGHLLDQMKTNGLEKEFWAKLGPMFKLSTDTDLFVSDSHLFAYPLAEDADLVIFFDRHHDCYQWPTFKELHTSKKYEVDCGNWVSTWLSMGPKRRAMWVHPNLGNIADEVCFAGVEPGRRDRFTAISYERHQDLTQHFVYGDELVVHICRSGCWTPPWLDQAFIDFVNEPKLQVQVMQEGIWNPMKLRWNEDDYQTCKEVQEKEQQLRLNVNTPVGSSENRR